MKVFIGTPDKRIVIVDINTKKNTIKSLCRGAIPTLRKYGWSIRKKGQSFFDRF